MKKVLVLSFALILGGCESAQYVVIGAAATAVNASSGIINNNPNAKSRKPDDGLKRCAYKYSEWLTKIEPCRNQRLGI